MMNIRKTLLSCILTAAVLLAVFSLPLSAASVTEMNRLFENKLTFLDNYYQLGAEYMCSVMADVFYPWDEANANGWKLKNVPEKDYEDTLKLYFAPTAKDIEDLRALTVHDIEQEALVPFYDAANKCYRVGSYGGFGGALPEREYLGYIVKDGGYEIFFGHITYEFLSDLVPEGDPLWAQIEADGWPEKVTYKGNEYQNGPDGFCRIASRDDYGNRYEVEYKKGIVRILSQKPYTKEDLPDAFATEPVTTTATATTTKKPSTTTTQKPATGNTTSATTASTTTTGGNVTTTTTTVPEKLTVLVQTDSATVEAAPDAFPADTQVKLEALAADTLSAPVKTALQKLAKSYVAYEITATADNVAVQPDGTVKATFAIPAGYDLDRVAVLYVSPDGQTETVPSTVDRASGKIVAELTHFSTYVVAELDQATASTTTTGAPSVPNTDTDIDGVMPPHSNFPWAIVAAVAVVLVAGGIIGLLVIKGKKK